MTDQPKPAAAAPLALLRAEDIEGLLARDDREVVVVEVPQWGCSVRVRALTALEAVEMSECKPSEGMAKIVSLSCIDQSGNLLFPDHTKLMGKSAAALNLLQNVALKLNNPEPRGAAKNG